MNENQPSKTSSNTSVEELQRRIHELEEENKHLKILLRHCKNTPRDVAEKLESGEHKSITSKESTLALRIQPLFSDDKCVEVVATVVKVPSKGSKKKKKPKKERKKNPKYLQRRKIYKKRLKQRRKHVVVAVLEPSEVLKNTVQSSHSQISEINTEKLKVLEVIQKYTPIKLIHDSEAIPKLLEKEVEKESSAFYLVNLGTVVDKWFHWKRYLPRVHPFYAVKANPDLNIVRTLHVLGSGFDCASKTEIEEVLLVGVPPQNIIYANPCKGKDHILFAKSKGVDLMTFDNASEIEKIHELFPTARLVLRILPDDSYSTMPFGSKFGAPFEECIKLIELCKSKNMNLVGVSFHVGSGCYATIAYVEAIKLARRVFDEAEKRGFNLSLLDLGGGWPGVETGPLTFAEIAQEIGPLIDELFPPAKVRVIAEPGRYFCTACYTLAVNVISRRERYINPTSTTKTSIGSLQQSEESSDDLELESFEGGIESDIRTEEKLEKFELKHKQKTESIQPVKEILYYLSDGVYGSFNNIIFDHAHPEPLPIDHTSSSTTSPTEHEEDPKTKIITKSRLFGPTCDSIDVICQDIELPELRVGDWLYFMNMGAYTVASATHFNGFVPPNARYIMTLSEISNSNDTTTSTMHKKDASERENTKELSQISSGRSSITSTSSVQESNSNLSSTSISTQNK